MSRRNFLVQTAAAAASLGLGCRRASPRSPRGPERRVLVLGLDGLDPGLCERLMDAGRMPALNALRGRDGYRRLGTTVPPQSPVAWASFITGADPGSHGIFDFIHRDPSRQAAPFFSAAETVRGPWGERTVCRRKGVAFWEPLGEAGVGSAFYFLPSDYPPTPSRGGARRCLSGMGVPDLMGTHGTYQLFHEGYPPSREAPGAGRWSRLRFEAGTASVEMEGPPGEGGRPATLRFSVDHGRDPGTAAVVIQGRRIALRAGEWSPWTPVRFRQSPGLGGVRGMCRFRLQEAPEVRLYVSPLNIDPRGPAARISEPAGFASELARAVGPFHTMGFPEDHKALSEGVFTEEEFADQAGSVLEERLRLLDYALSRFGEGVLFFHLLSSDIHSHMFWWDSEEKHPTRAPAQARAWFGKLADLYARLDGVVGEALSRVGAGATTLVLSDHGFANFRRQFDLNGWLRANGYLHPADATSILHGVDWSRTRAYGLGLNGLYLNMEGRERDGIVKPGAEREGLLRELKAKLEAVRDEDGRPVLRRVHRADEAYRGGRETALSPDLVLGYRRGWRASWATCLGGVGGAVLSDNDRQWSADHCIDPSEVPGVLFCTKPLKAEAPHIIDLAPTILAEFGLPAPGNMQGKTVL